jgi:hypothetical protein
MLGIPAAPVFVAVAGSADEDLRLHVDPTFLRGKGSTAAESFLFSQTAVYNPYFPKQYTKLSHLVSQHLHFVSLLD